VQQGWLSRFSRAQDRRTFPIEQPTHFAFEVNMKIAKALGITIQPAIIVQATRVIE
jgi:putative tryptophan/tyrosine transport system substrate-binding protein